MVKEEIVFDIHSEFHMLRHFEVPDDLVIQNIIKNGYKKIQIQSEIEFIGSRFFKSFACNISDLLSQLLKFEYNIIEAANGNLVLEFLVPFENYPYGIGTNSIISKKSLSNSEIERIYYLNNREYLIAHLDISKLPITNVASVIVKKVEDKFIFITAFPGITAMPIPDNKMSNELFILSKKFWDEHVFLKISIT